MIKEGVLENQAEWIEKNMGKNNRLSFCCIIFDGLSKNDDTVWYGSHNMQKKYRRQYIRNGGGIKGLNQQAIVNYVYKKQYLEQPQKSYSKRYNQNIIDQDGIPKVQLTYRFVFFFSF